MLAPTPQGTITGGYPAVTTVDEIRTIKERVEKDLLARPGVVGVGIGYKRVGGTATGQLAIRVYVVVKSDEIADDDRVPAEIEGVPTDVVESGGFEPHRAEE